MRETLYYILYHTEDFRGFKHTDISAATLDGPLSLDECLPVLSDGVKLGMRYLLVDEDRYDRFWRELVEERSNA